MSLLKKSVVLRPAEMSYFRKLYCFSWQKKGHHHQSKISNAVVVLHARMCVLTVCVSNDCRCGCWPAAGIWTPSTRFFTWRSSSIKHIIDILIRSSQTGLFSRLLLTWNILPSYISWHSFQTSMAYGHGYNFSWLTTDCLPFLPYHLSGPRFRSGHGSPQKKSLSLADSLLLNYALSLEWNESLAVCP